MADSPEPIQVRVGKRIRKLRKAKDWSQDALYAASGVNRATISDIENGKQVTGIDILERLTKGLETTLSELLRDI